MPSAPSIRDVIELALLAVVTFTSIGRWIEARERKEKEIEKTGAEGITATRGDLAEFEKRHSEEHARIWREIERNRKHWHEDMVPFQQKMIERIATVEGVARAHAEDLARLQGVVDRRRDLRGD